MKFALVSHVLPPSPSGQAIALYRVLRDFDPNEYCLISSSLRSSGSQLGIDRQLGAPHHYLPPEWRLRVGNRWLQKLRTAVTLPWVLVARAIAIARILAEERCRALIACTGGSDLLDVPASFLAARWNGVPFFVYALDYYSYQWLGPHEWRPLCSHRFGSWMERLTHTKAQTVLVPNEFLQDALKARYGINPVVVRNACDRSDIYPPSPHPKSAEKSSVTIVYTGMVYDAHHTAFRSLLRAMALLPGASKLHIYTSQPPEQLTRHGITGPVFIHPHCSTDKVADVHKSADILFLPLAAATPYPELIRTSAPAKMGEYLASGTPVLVHAPADSFVSWYFQKNQCGFVVPEGDDRQVATTLMTAASDDMLRQASVTNAARCAASDFSITAAHKAFAGALRAARIDP